MRSQRSAFRFTGSPDSAFPADLSPQRPSSASASESSAPAFLFPPLGSDAQSSASSNNNDSFNRLSIDQIFPADASSLANRSSSSQSVSLSFIDHPDDSESREGYAKTFTFRELSTATMNFSPGLLLGGRLNNVRPEFRGRLFGSRRRLFGMGSVYKGRLETTGQVVAVKNVERHGFIQKREFVTEVLMLSFLRHPNLVNAIGHCDKRLLVYEYMPLGSLEDHLHYLPPDREPLDWNTRMKIAAGAAKGLEYLHDTVSPPVIHRNLKPSNILLGEGYHPKLSDFGLSILAPLDDRWRSSYLRQNTDVYYCAPECNFTGNFTLKSDVYCFGIVLLELITGRKDRRNVRKMADPLLQGHYPKHGFYQAIAIAAECLQESVDRRPPIGKVAMMLTDLASQTYDPNATSTENGRGSSSPSSIETRGEGRSIREGGLESPADTHDGMPRSPSTHNGSDYLGGVGSDEF